jgi:hypothetical protein
MRAKTPQANHIEFQPEFRRFFPLKQGDFA